MPVDPDTLDIAPYIDHSLLDPLAGVAEVDRYCNEAVHFNFAAVCIYPAYVRQAAERLHKQAPKVCTVIGFPTGATTATTKLYEASEAIENGAQELDVVVNLGLLKSGKTDDFHREIAAFCEETGVPVKAILETTLLSDEEKKIAAELCMDAGVAFLKTSTGWRGGATVADVRLLQEIAKGNVGIKASGGIRTPEGAIDLIVAGATRLGTSRGVELLKQRDSHYS